MDKNDEKIWYEDLSVLLNNCNIFIPLRKYSVEKRINALVRFCIYLTLIILILEKNDKYIYIIPIILLISYILHKFKLYRNIEYFRNVKREKYIIKKPTKDNPLMNQSYFDIGNDKPISKRDKSIKNSEIDKLLIDESYYDPGDTKSIHMLCRNFIHVPENDGQGELARKLYDYPSCKKGNKELCYLSLAPGHGSTFSPKTSP